MKGLMSVVLGTALLTVGLVSRPPDNAMPPVEIVTTELMLSGGSKDRATKWTFTGNMRSSTPATCVTTDAPRTSVMTPTMATEQYSQAIDIPARGATALKYKVRMQRAESQAVASDNLVVKINAMVVNTLTTTNPQDAYAEYTHDLSALAGTRARVEFEWTFDNSLSSNFCIDDVIASNSR